MGNQAGFERRLPISIPRGGHGTPIFRTTPQNPSHPFRGRLAVPSAGNDLGSHHPTIRNQGWSRNFSSKNYQRGRGLADVEAGTTVLSVDLELSPSSDATASRRRSGLRWAYRSVMLNSRWPSSSWTSLRLRPFMMSHEAHVCHRSWK